MSELGPGARLGAYEVIRPLARGGMAELYLARMNRTGGFEKVVVLKRILPSIARDRALVAMFLDEARLSATLHHPNIVEVFDIGSESGTYFFAMEHVHGVDIRKLRYEAQAALHPIPLAIVLAIVVGTTSALAYAHSRSGPNGPLGVVHRDVTPSNILISYDGATKLVDFGIARATSRSTRTPSGVLRGNIRYMSPEQCRSKALDRRSDLFSLGIVLYELTCGVRPFLGRSDFSILEAITSGPIAPPSTVVPGYPHELEAIVMRLLERELECRYQTADQVLNDLEAFVTSQNLFISALGIAKYVRYLFANDIAAWELAHERGITLSNHLAEARSAPSRASLPLADARWASGAPEWARDSVRGEGSVLLAAARGPDAPSSDATQADLVAPFDPLDAFRVEVLAELDVDAPRPEARDRRTARRIDKLVALAVASHRAGELEKAVTTLDLAMSEDADTAASRLRLRFHHAAIKAIFDAFVGWATQVPILSRPFEDFESEPSFERWLLLLSHVDGIADIAELSQMTGFSEVETYRQLSALILRGIVSLESSRHDDGPFDQM